ncbi:hypothetical protein EFO40_02530 [Lactococcus cremoris]|uniref:hypothetical protein n=1 Tax=Lactobacillales TaxID=186826 RepID=UPI0020741F28|nr:MULTISPECIES: hypothetical protein [Lactobacillales]MCT4462425.1 hypothetical protein [Lactococcus cremoris]
MSEDLKTIKELADELGLAKQTVQYHLKFLPTENRQKNNSGSIVLNLEEQKFIKKRLTKIKKVQPTKNRQKTDKKSTKKNEELSVNSLLLEQIKDLKEVNKQLLESQKQTQNLLDQQQRLALQDKNLLEEYKAENDRLKVLKMPSQETEFKHLDNQYKDEVNALKEKLENLQEQIKDQKRIEEQEKPRKWWGLWRK